MRICRIDIRNLQFQTTECVIGSFESHEALIIDLQLIAFSLSRHAAPPFSFQYLLL